MRILTILGLATTWLTTSTIVSLPLPHGSGLSQHHSTHLALERRTNDPPPRRLTPEEFRAKMQRVETQVSEFMERYPAKRTEVARTLGIEPEQLFLQDVNPARMNAALQQAGYQGELLPEREILEYMAETRRVLGEIEALFGRDPELKRRFRAALGLPNAAWPQGPNSRAILNRALRQAGHRGPFFPEGPGQSRSSGRDQGEEGGGAGAGPNDRFSSVYEKTPSSSAGFVGSVMQSLRGPARKTMDVLKSVQRSSATTGSGSSPSQPLPLLPGFRGPVYRLGPI